MIKIHLIGDTHVYMRIVRTTDTHYILTDDQDKTYWRVDRLLVFNRNSEPYAYSGNVFLESE